MTNSQNTSPSLQAVWKRTAAGGATSTDGFYRMQITNKQLRELTGCFNKARFGGR